MSASNLKKTAVRAGVDNRWVILDLEVSTIVPIAASTGANHGWATVWQDCKAVDGQRAL